MKNFYWNYQMGKITQLGLKAGLLLFFLMFINQLTAVGQNIDLTMSSTVSEKAPILGQNITYSVVLKNEGDTTAHGVVSQIETPAGAISNVDTIKNRGTLTYNAVNGIITWSIDSLIAGDSAILIITADASARGVFFVIAQVTSANELDFDSTPNNSNLAEDDLATTCFGVPLLWYPGDEYTVSIPSPYGGGSGVIWFKDGVPIDSTTVGAAVNPDSTLRAFSPGSYTFTTTINTCPADGCCPVILEQGPYGSIGDFVWEDANNNGLQDAGEAGVANVPVDLYDDGGNLLFSTITDSLGIYAFDSLFEGNYQLAFTSVDNRDFTPNISVGPDSLDSDVDGTGFTPVFGITLVDAQGNLLGGNAGQIDYMDAGLTPIPVFDLALRKTLASSQTSYNVGDEVVFDLTVFNQGNQVASFINVVDYVPVGYTISSSNWTITNGIAQYNNQLSLLPGDSTTIQIRFTVNQNAPNGALTNAAEIRSAQNAKGLDDIDSTPDAIANNDGPAINDVINQDGKNGGDEDDSDFETVMINKTFDLALRKTIVGNDTLRPNDTVTYSIKLFNQGFTDASFIKVVDVIPSGLTLTDLNWTIVGDTATYNLDVSLAAGDSTEINITFSVNADQAGLLRNSSEIASAKDAFGNDVVDIDSNFDKDPSNDGLMVNDVIDQDGKNGGDEDDSDFAEIFIIPYTIDLHLTKALANTSPVYPGDSITFNISVANEGSINATAISIVDYIPAGLTLADANWTVSNGKAFKNTLENIAVGVTKTFPITFVANSSTLAGNYANSAEIADAKGPLGEAFNDIDSTPDADPTNDAPGEDDFGTVNYVISEFARISGLLWDDSDNDGIQEVTETSMLSGIVIKLKLPDGTVVDSTVTDSQGRYVFATVKAGDYAVAFSSIPSYGFTLPYQTVDTLDSDADQATGESQIMTFVAGQQENNIDAGYFFNVTCDQIANVVASSSSACVGETITITASSVNGSDIAFYSSASGGTPYLTALSDEVVSFTLNATTTYYIGIDSNDVSCPSSIVNLTVVANPVPATPQVTAAADICIGDVADLSTYLISGNSTAGGIFEYHVSNDPTSALVPNPAAVSSGTYYVFEKSGAGCYSAAAAIVITEKNCSQLVDLELVKIADNRYITLNDTINFTLEILNRGPAQATNIEIQDKLPASLTFVSSPSMTLVNGVLTGNIPSLNAGERTYLYYKTIVNTVGTIINLAEISKVDQTDVDSTPGNANTTNEDDDDDEVINVLEPTPAADLNLAKLVDNAAPAVGDQVTYTINVTNSGPAIATNVGVNDMIPAGLQFDSASGATSVLNTGNNVDFTIDTIAVGETVSMQILATVLQTGQIINRAEVSKADQPDSDSVPGTGSNEDDDDTAIINAVDACQFTTITAAANQSSVCPGDLVTFTASGCIGTVEWSNGQTGASISVTVTQTTSLSAQCRVSANCLSPASNIVTVSVNNPPAPAIAISSTEICNGDFVTLTSSGCLGTVNWSNGMTGTSFNVTPVVNTTYTATCTLFGCTSAVSNSVNVIVNPRPSTPTITASKSTICIGDSTSLTATNCNSTLVWNTGATTPTIRVAPIANTTYTVTCGNNACATTATKTIDVNGGFDATITASATSICAGDSVTLNVSACTSSVIWNTGATTSSIKVAPNVTQSYTAICGNSSCADTKSITINVSSGVPPVISALNSTICEGTSTTLTATGCGGTVRWSNGQTGASITVNPVAQTTYTAVCQGATCTSANSNTLTVQVTAKPPTPAVQNLSNVCPIATVNLNDAITTKVNGITYEFKTTNSSTGVNVSNATAVATNGTYFVFGKNAAGCYSSGASITTVITVCDTTPVCTTPAIANAGNDTTICITNGVLTLSGSIGGSATTSRWSSNGTGTFTNAGTLNARYNFSEADIANGSVIFTLTTNDPDGTTGGCTPAIDSKTVTINGISNKPTITSTGNTSFCSGDSVILTASANTSGYTYIWNSGDTTRTIKATTSGAYFVQYVNANGCRSLPSAVVTVNSNSSIAKPIVNDFAENACPETTVNLSTHIYSQPLSANGVFEIRTGSNPTSALVPNINAVTNGVYYVFEKTTDGCYSVPADITVSINNCVIDSSSADIEIIITGNKSEADLGDTVTYTITVRNLGPATATNVDVQNIIPAGLSLVSTPAGMTLNGNELHDIIDTLLLNQSVVYTYKATVKSSGTLSNIATITGLDQVDPRLSNNTSKFDLLCATCQDFCIANALKADTLNMGDGTYNIIFTSHIQNCGNTDFTMVGLNYNMKTMFGNTATYTIVQAPQVNSGSTLKPNPLYNGNTVTKVLMDSTSTLKASEFDTITWIVNLAPNGTVGPYSGNAIARGTGKSLFGFDTSVSDVSNNGNIIIKSSAEPTVVRLFKTPEIALTLAIVDTTYQEDGSINVTYKALVKNTGSLPLNSVVVNDTLANTFKLPSSYTMVSAPTVNSGSTLVPDTNYNGNNRTRLTLSSSVLPVGITDTITFVINVVPDTIKRFPNQADVIATGILKNGTVQTVTDLSNNGLNPDLPGADPTVLIISEPVAPVSCLGVALYVGDSTKLDDGSYNITYYTLIYNCGTVELTDVTLCDSLKPSFPDPAQVRLIGKPFVPAGSGLVVDTTYNGLTNVCMLAPGSTLAPGVIDTVKWSFNLTLNSNNGPFRKNVTVTATDPDGIDISDISNAGKDPDPIGEAPTILNFNNLPPDLIGVAKELVDVSLVSDKLYDVTFKFVLKNYGTIDFTGVQIKDALSETWGENVRIDSVSVYGATAGLTINPNFTGKGMLTDMLVDTMSTLPINTTEVVYLLNRVDLTNATESVFENMALAVGYFNGLSTDDVSTEGANPDPDADGTPLNNSDPTIIDFSDLISIVNNTPLGIAKSIDTLAKADDGSYQVRFKVVVVNYGSDTLKAITLVDSLGEVFGDSTTFSIVDAPYVQNDSSSTLTPNPDFDGLVDMDLVIADSSYLLTGGSDTLYFTVKVRNLKDSANTYFNSIYGTALDITKTVTDISNVGEDPDEDGDNNPGNNNESTPITLDSGMSTDSTTDVSVMGGISPNDDGFNDHLIITGITESDSIHIRIYNRWGHMVFETENYKATFPGNEDGWGGEVNTGILLTPTNNYVPDGTYFYRIDSSNPRHWNGKPYINNVEVAGSKRE